MSFVDDKTLKSILLASMVVVALFFIALSVYLVKINNDDYCGVDNNFQLDQTKNTFYGTVINSNDDYVVQSLDIDKKLFNYFEYYNFCFNANVSTTSYLELNVIDGEETVLGTTYLYSNSSDWFCVDIGNPSLTIDNNFVGLQCVNCDSSNNITLGNDLSLSEATMTADGVVLGSSVNYNLLGVKNCKHFFKELFSYMIIFVLLISLIWAIKLFVDWMERFSFDGW